MSERSYRSTVVVSAVLWFMLGLHAPIVHQFTHHGRTPDVPVVVAVALLAIAGIGTLLVLWRAPRMAG